MRRATRLLVRGGRVLTMDDRIGDLDAAGMIVTPGFVDTHRHVWQTRLRTVAADWSLFDYFVRMRSVYGSFYEPED